MRLLVDFLTKFIKRFQLSEYLILTVEKRRFISYYSHQLGLRTYENSHENE